jgi:cell division protein FtsQ
VSTTSTWHPSRGPIGMPALRIERARARTVPRRAAGARLLSVIGIVAVLAAGWWVTGSKIFALRTLQVVGNAHLSSEQVAGLAGLSESTNVFWLSSNRIERRLQSNPWVASATVSRTLPSEVKVVIRERVPVAVLLDASGVRFLVAADGVVLGSAGRGVALPTIVAPPPGAAVHGRIDPRTPALSVAASLPPSLRARVTAVDVKGGQATLALRGGGKVLFGDPSESAAKSEALLAVLSWADRNGVHPASVDVRAPAAPALRPSAPSTQVTGTSPAH